MSLNFKKGSSLCKIDGGKYDNEIVYIYDNIEDINKRDRIPFNTEIIQPIFKKMKGKNRKIAKHMDKIINRIGNNYDSDSDDFTDDEEDFKLMMMEAKKIKNEKMDKEIILHDGNMIPIPNTDLERNTIYIAGPSGSGKSTWISEYLKYYKKIYPDRSIYLFSRKSDDPALDKIKKINRIKIDSSLYEEPIDIEKEMKNTMVIFDDTDSIQDSKIKKAINSLKDDILQTGRAYKIDCIITAHNVTNYKESRIILQECQNVVLFTRSGVSRQTKYYLENYIGLKKDQVDKIFKLPSRWVMIKQTAPTAIVYQSGAYLL